MTENQSPDRWDGVQTYLVENLAYAGKPEDLAEAEKIVGILRKMIATLPPEEFAALCRQSATILLAEAEQRGDPVPVGVRDLLTLTDDEIAERNLFHRHRHKLDEQWMRDAWAFYEVVGTPFPLIKKA